jgi:hypothetical protein
MLKPPATLRDVSGVRRSVAEATVAGAGESGPS